MARKLACLLSAAHKGLTYVDKGAQYYESRHRITKARFAAGLCSNQSLLFDFARTLLAIALTRESFLGAALFARLQIKRVALDFLYDVFLLNLALEAAQRTFERLTVL
jgi:hypothetical protein